MCFFLDPLKLIHSQCNWSCNRTDLVIKTSGETGLFSALLSWREMYFTVSSTWVYYIWFMNNFSRSSRREIHFFFLRETPQARAKIWRKGGGRGGLIRWFDIPSNLQFKKLAPPSSPQKFTYKPAFNYSYPVPIKKFLLTKMLSCASSWLLSCAMFQSLNLLEAQ